MGMHRLFFGGTEFPLRQLSSKSFEFFREHDFVDLVRPEKIVRGRLLAAVILDSQNLQQEVEAIRATLSGNSFSLFAFIVGQENEESFAFARQLMKQDDFFCFYDGDPVKARSVALDLANSVVRSGEVLTFFDRYTDKPRFSVGSFCSVTTRETMRECNIMLQSVRRFHAEPFFVVCDKDSESYLQGAVENLTLVRGDLCSAKKKTEEFYDKDGKKCNDFHRPDAIFQKMEAMDVAIENCRATFFLDADIVAMDQLADGFAQPTALSPHYSKRRTAGVSYGVFNAGYVYSSEQSFPTAWRDIYLRRSKFYEQEGMRHLLNDFECQIFGREHNVGFWRDPSDFDCEVKSFHAHLSPDLDQTAGSAVLNLHKEHRTLVRDYIAKKDPELDRTISEILDT